MLTHLQQDPALPARVVLLGASGFVGGRLADRLKASSIPTLRLSSADVDLVRSESVELLRCSLDPRDSLVFISAITPDKGKDVGTLMRNLTMGEHVCGVLREGACAHLLYISSDAVYDDESSPLTERSTPNPGGLHGLMHLARERMLAEASRSARIPLAILRPSLLYGTGDTHNSYGPNRFVRTALAEGRIRLFGHGEEKRDHVHVEDLSRLAELVLLHRSTGVLNVATGRSCSFLEVAQLARSASLGPVQVEFAPRSGPIAHRHFDLAGLVRAFPGFRFTPLAEGLSEMVRRVAATA